MCPQLRIMEFACNTALWARISVIDDEAGQVIRGNPDYVDDPHMGKAAFGGPLVDGGGADAEELRDLPNRQQLLNRR